MHQAKTNVDRFWGAAEKFLLIFYKKYRYRHVDVNKISIPYNGLFYVGFGGTLHIWKKNKSGQSC